MRKIEAVMFDLDGVLVDACDWHYFALNEALMEVVGTVISRHDHETTYNGLPTNVKLEMLGLDENQREKVWELKQDRTLKTIRENAKNQVEKVDLFESLIDHDIKIACVTNSIRMTANEMLHATGQLNYFDEIISNEDVENNKPYPDCYNFAVNKLDVDPDNCIIVEDSMKGMQAAQSSVVPIENIWHVQNSEDVTKEGMWRFVNENFDTNGR